MTKLTIFYDGTCPLCAKEMKALRQHDHKQEINTVDIYSDAFSAYPQIDPDRANTILHALDNHGNLLLGLDVTYRAWQLVDEVGCMHHCAGDSSDLLRTGFICASPKIGIASHIG